MTNKQPIPRRPHRLLGAASTLTLALVLAADGCVVDEGAEDSGGTGGTPATGVTAASTSVPGTDAEDTGDEESGSCEPGAVGCACADDVCQAALVCVADICSWPPPDGDDGSDEAPPIETGNEESSGMDTAEDSGPTACGGNSECTENEACGPDNVCVFAFDLAYEIRIPGWWPDTCVDNGLDADADLWWQLELDGVVAGESGWVQGGCPGSWPETTACIPAGGFYGAFVLYAWDEDGAEDGLRDILWWDYGGDGFADSLDPQYLHAGVYDDVTNTGGSVLIEFTVVEGCY